MRKKTTTFFDLFYKIMTILIILAGITYIIINLVYTEGFSSLSHSYSENKALSRTNLQFLLNRFESQKRCGSGYIQPSNPCNHSYNTNFYTSYYKTYFSSI